MAIQSMRWAMRVKSGRGLRVRRQVVSERGRGRKILRPSLLEEMCMLCLEQPVKVRCRSRRTPVLLLCYVWWGPPASWPGVLSSLSPSEPCFRFIHGLSAQQHMLRSLLLPPPTPPPTGPKCLLSVPSFPFPPAARPSSTYTWHTVLELSVAESSPRGARMIFFVVRNRVLLIFVCSSSSSVEPGTQTIYSMVSVDWMSGHNEREPLPFWKCQLCCEAQHTSCGTAPNPHLLALLFAKERLSPHAHSHMRDARMSGVPRGKTMTDC